MTTTALRGVRRTLVAALYLLFLTSLGEVVARAFWSARHARPFLSTAPLLYTFYPEIREVGSGVQAEDEPFDVLLLGASVLAPQFTNIERELREQLTLASGRRIRVHNVSTPGHTTLDSYFKYAALYEVPFDLVAVYHGINELRANNAPAEVFKADYSHYGWYAFLNDDRRRLSRQWLILPETITWFQGRIRDRLGADIVAMNAPRPEWLEYGADVKTVTSFRSNLLRIRDLAATRDTPLVLMTFAHYLAPGYSQDAFRNHRLDYLTFETMTEVWGLPTAIDRGIDLHNDVVVELSQLPGVLFVDQAAAIPDGRTYYNDICHFTSEGSRLFVRNLLPVVLPLVGGQS